MLVMDHDRVEEKGSVKNTLRKKEAGDTCEEYA